MPVTLSQHGSLLTPGNASAFDMASGRERLSVAIGDADDSNEVAGAELAINDNPDRGATIKIGGYVNNVAPGAVAVGDRANAWFTWHGQLGCVATREANAVHDGGARRNLIFYSATLAHNNSTNQVIAANATMRHKVLSVSVQCYAFTTSGLVYITDGTTAAFYLANCWGQAQSWFLSNAPLILYQTGINYPLQVGGSGNGSFMWSLVYYTSP